MQSIPKSIHIGCLAGLGAAVAKEKSMRWFLLLSICFLVVLAIPVKAQPRSVESIPRSHTRVTLFWLPPVDGTAQSYRLTLNGQRVADLPEGKSFDFEELQPGETYRFGVQVVYTDGRESPLIERSDRPFRKMEPEKKYPIVVIGGTSAGVGASIAAARMGHKVAFFEETNRLGGMISNGVAVTDVRRPERINGLFEEYRQRVVQFYQTEQGANTSRAEYWNGLRYEPWVANMLIKRMVYEEPNIDLFFGIRPIRTLRKGNRVIGVEMESVIDGSRSKVYGEIVIDATVEADVAAWGGAKWRMGREPRTPEEPHAGEIYYDRQNDLILPGSTGRGDKRLQAYAILPAVADYGDDRTIPTPPGYNPQNYILAPPWEQSWAVLYGRMPNGKFEINQHPHGSDLQEVNYGWITASYAERKRIYEKYKQNVLGYLHYIQTVQGKPGVMLAEDEYRDSDHLPPILYVREARRIVGLVDFKEMDVIRARERIRPDSIGIGDYPMDSHAVRKVIIKENEDHTFTHMGEGEYWLFQYTPWYQVPYGVIVPQGVESLLVPAAVSATHLGYGTLRMEPVRMATGQAAGVAAALSLNYRTQPARLSIADIQKQLVKMNVYLYFFPDVKPETEHFQAIQFLGARGYFLDELFEPQKSLTRAQAAHWLWKHIQERNPKIEERLYEGLGFIDVPFTHPAAVPVKNLYRLGVIDQPTNRRFLPEEPVKRADFARWLVNAQALIDPSWKPSPGVAGNAPYIDVPIDHPDFTSILRLHSRGIRSFVWDGWESATPEGIRFQPDAPISRADAAVSLFMSY